jgi:hypothetical protein
VSSFVRNSMKSLLSCGLFTISVTAADVQIKAHQQRHSTEPLVFVLEEITGVHYRSGRPGHSSLHPEPEFPVSRHRNRHCRHFLIELRIPIRFEFPWIRTLCSLDPLSRDSSPGPAAGASRRTCAVSDGTSTVSGHNRDPSFYNWTFIGSDNGGKTAATLRSFVSPANSSGSFAWVRDMLSRIAGLRHPGNPAPHYPAATEWRNG